MGQDILDRLIAYLLSPQGEETWTQLAAGLRSNGNGGLDLSRLLDLSSVAGRLHPEFRVSTLARSLGGYLLSQEGKPARDRLLVASSQWLMAGLAGQLNRLSRPATPPPPVALLTEGD